MPYQIKNYIARSGERFSLLYDSELGGFPLFYPTAYITRNIRTSNTHETQKTYLHAIKKFYDWLDSTKTKLLPDGINLHERILSKRFLSPFEIDSLAQFLSIKKRSTTSETISIERNNMQLDVVAGYLKWYANEVIVDPNDPQTQIYIDKFSTSILANKIKVKSKTAKTQELLAKKLPDKVSEQLLVLFDAPLKDIDRKADHATRKRTILGLRILYETGMRIGELLSLKLTNYSPSYGGHPATIFIERNHDDPNDDRVSQPTVKTNERIVPISQNLAVQIEDYLVEREKVPNVEFGDEAPLLVTHKRCDRQGKSVEKSTMVNCFGTLKKQFPILKPLHPHLLRHDWNYRFSKEADKLGLNEHEERERREYLMGWAENSAMSHIYNQRRIQEEGLKIGLQVANHTSRKRDI